MDRTWNSNMFPGFKPCRYLCSLCVNLLVPPPLASHEIPHASLRLPLDEASPTQTITIQHKTYRPARTPSSVLPGGCCSQVHNAASKVLRHHCEAVAVFPQLSEEAVLWQGGEGGQGGTAEGGAGKRAPNKRYCAVRVGDAAGGGGRRGPTYLLCCGGGRRGPTYLLCCGGRHVAANVEHAAEVGCADGALGVAVAQRALRQHSGGREEDKQGCAAGPSDPT